MKKVVKELVELQEIDSRFDVLQLQKGDLPMMIEEAEQDLKDKQDRRDELQEKISKGEADRRMFQSEIEASKEKLKKYEDQLYSVQTNKEYDAISLEIDTKKMEVSELENKILQSLEEEEETKKIIEELGGDIAKLEEQLKDYREELKEIIEQTEEEEKRLSNERKKIVAEIDDRYLRQYDRIRKAKDGLAVVPVKRGSCGGCFSAIPPQKIVEIHENNRLYTCEHCGRILVWVDED
ncbi:MAG: C4-type zinc ribbon domain-containing protein [Calditrichia bacterium]